MDLPERLQEAIRLSHGAPERPPGLSGLALHHAVFLSGRLAEVWISARPPEVTRAALGAAADQLGLTLDLVSAALQRMAAAVPEASTDFDLDLGGPDRVQSVLDEAKRLLGARRPAVGSPGPDPARRCRPRPSTTSRPRRSSALRGGRPSALLVIRAAAEGTPEDAELARGLLTSFRQTDVLAREAGQYLALLVDTPAAGAQVVAERLRARLSAAGLDAAVGLACLPDSAIGAPSGSSPRPAPRSRPRRAGAPRDPGAPPRPPRRAALPGGGRGPGPRPDRRAGAGPPGLASRLAQLEAAHLQLRRGRPAGGGRPAGAGADA